MSLGMSWFRWRLASDMLYETSHRFTWMTRIFLVYSCDFDGSFVPRRTLRSTKSHETTRTRPNLCSKPTISCFSGKNSIQNRSEATARKREDVVSRSEERRVGKE